MKKITIIGGGPAALMLAAHIDLTQYDVTLIDKKKSVGRKFLVAGEGGLNLTFNASLDKFINKYHPSDFMDTIIRNFTNEDFINWLHTLEVPTFIGSSNRVFPDLDLKPIEVLNKITNHISNRGIKFQLNTKWLGWNKEGNLSFDAIDDITSDIVVFAMGGASWKVTGSSGTWLKEFKKRNISTQDFRAANCAFEVNWNEDLIAIHEGKPLKNIALTYNTHFSKGELVVSKFGLEGNAIYALSQKIQDHLHSHGSAIVYLDLKPTMTADQIKSKYKKSRKTKPTYILKKDLHLDATAIAILKQFTDKDTYANIELLSKIIKAVPIPLKSSAPLDEAISSLGGISLNEVDKNLQYKKIPNSYAIGEMLDWYAPTGGYLLQGCFSMGYTLAQYLNHLDS